MSSEEPVTVQPTVQGIDLQNVPVVGVVNSSSPEPLPVLNVKAVEEELQSTKDVKAPAVTVPSGVTNGEKTPGLVETNGGTGEELAAEKVAPADIHQEKHIAETPKKRGRGRPKKRGAPVGGADKQTEGADKGHVAATPKKRGRGRPKKSEGDVSLNEGAVEQGDNYGDDEDQIEETPTKRGRGRPRKSEQPAASLEEPSSDIGESVDHQEAGTSEKRGRGRPRKDGLSTSLNKGPPTKRRPSRSDRLNYDEESVSDGSSYRPERHQVSRNKWGEKKKRGRGRPPKATPTKSDRPARKDRLDYTEGSETDESDFEDYDSVSSQETIPDRRAVAKKKRGRPRKDENIKGKGPKKRGRGRPRKSEQAARLEKEETSEESEYESPSEDDSSNESDAGDPSFGKSPRKKAKDDEDYSPKKSGARRRKEAKLKNHGRGRPRKSGQKKRGRPRKSQPSEDAVGDGEPAVKRKRGRPRKSIDHGNDSVVSTPGDDKPKRGRGRPRKSEYSVEEAEGLSGDEPESTSLQTAGTADRSTPDRKRGRPKGSQKRKRGRPKKNEQPTVLEKASVSTERDEDVTESPTKRGRGRPRKSEEPESADGGPTEKAGEGQDDNELAPNMTETETGPVGDAEIAPPQDKVPDAQPVNDQTTPPSSEIQHNETMKPKPVAHGSGVQVWSRETVAF